MRVAFTNLGCKLNQAELEDQARRFAGAGHQVVGSPTDADLHVVNSCAVTVAAARDSRKASRRASRANPSLRTVLTGCYVESDPLDAAELAGVDLVVPNADKETLLSRVHAAFPELDPVAGAGDLPYAPLDFGNARALLKIEDGCDMKCSFCIIPSTRGRQHSRPQDEIVREVRGLTAAGFPEIVLTGVQISSYRSDGGLYELTRRLLEETAVQRLRLSSIAPWEFDPRLLDLFAEDRLCQHFHLSLQSGCDQTLRRMRRPYSTDQFSALAAVIRDRLPRAAVTTDVIVGFPGEDTTEFESSLRFVSAQHFARVHAFPYSERPGTMAATMPARVTPHEIKRRMARLLETARRSASRFAEGQLGRTVPVLWETRPDGLWHGTSDNYLRVVVAAERDLTRRLLPARLTAVDGSLVRGELVE